MTTKEAKQWLSRGFWLRQEIEQISAARRELIERFTSITPNTEGETVSGSKDPHKYDALAILDSELAEKEKKLKQDQLDIYRVIEAVTDTQYRILLFDRYYRCKQWPEIAAKMNYEERQLYRIHGAALAAAAVMIEKIARKK